MSPKLALIVVHFWVGIKLIYSDKCIAFLDYKISILMDIIIQPSTLPSRDNVPNASEKTLTYKASYHTMVTGGS